MNDLIKILQLEDDEHILPIVKRLLKSAGLDVEIYWVKTRNEFETILSEKKFELIIADYSLPDFNGLQALEFVRSKDKDIPFILFSGSIGEEKAIDSLRKGCTDYVLKHNTKALAPAVKRALNEYRQISERQKAQAIIEERELFLRSISSAALDGIIMLDSVGKISFWNEAAETIFGYRPDEIIGEDLSKLHISEDFYNKFMYDLSDFVKTGKAEAVDKVTEVIAKNKTGHILYIELSLSGTCIKGKWHAVGVLRDISNRKKNEQIKNSTIKIASEAISSKSETSFYKTIHRELKKFLDTTNMFIGTYDKISQKMHLPYMVDEKEKFNSFEVSGTLSGFVIKHNKALLLNGREILDFIKRNSIDHAEITSKSWMGVPLDVNNEAIGIIVLHNYHSETMYSENDFQILKLIASQISVFIKNKEIEKKLLSLSRSVDQSPVSIMITDLNGNIEYVNPAFCKITGYSLEEVWHKKPSILQSGKTDPQVYEDLWKTITKGQVWRGVFNNRKKNGEIFIEEATISPVLDDKNNIIQYISLKQDITHLKETEKALFLEKHMLDSLMNNIPDHIYYKDDQSRFVKVNKAMAKHTGFKDPAELINKTDFDLYKNGHAQEALKDEKCVMQNGHPITREEKEVWQDGRTTWVSTVKAPLHNESGEIIGTIGVSRDITERKNFEDTLKQNEDRLRIILESVAAGIVIADYKTGIINYVNSTALGMLRRGDREVLGHKMSEFLLASEESEKKRPHHEDSILLTDCFLVLPDEEKLPILKSAVLINTNGEEQLIESFVDIKKLKETERALSQAQKLESIGQMAAGIAHEINTPAQFVGDNIHFLKNSFADLMRLIQVVDEFNADNNETEKSANLTGHFSDLKEEIDYNFIKEEIPLAINQSLEGISRISKIVKAMKEFSHPGNKEKSSTDINRAITNTITVSRNEWKYVADLETDFQENIPAVMLYPDEFNQVILNIIINAAHAIAAVNSKNEKGKITIRTALKEEKVEIGVKDTGSGIPDNIAKKIFDPFFTTKEVGKGTGQGLAISHDVVVNKHNGTLEFNSEAGLGTEFIITLPVG